MFKLMQPIHIRSCVISTFPKISKRIRQQDTLKVHQAKTEPSSSVYRLSLHNAGKSASGLLGEAALLVTPVGDKACSKLDSAVDLALALALNNDVGGLDFNGHEAAEGASSLLGSAAGRAEGGDEALSKVDAAVLLAFSHVLDFDRRDVVLNSEALKAFECA